MKSMHEKKAARPTNGHCHTNYIEEMQVVGIK